MEHIGGVSEGEWTSLSGMYTAEEVDFMAQLLGNFPSSNHSVSGTTSMEAPQAFWPPHESITTMNMSSNYYSSETTNSSSQSYYLSDQSLPMLLTNNNISMSIDFGTRDGIPNLNSYLSQGDHLDQCLNHETSEEAIGEESRGNLSETREDQRAKPSKNSMKRSQSSDTVQMNKRNTKSKKSLQVTISNDDEDGNPGPNRQSSSSCCSGDDNNNIPSQSHDNNSTSTSSLLSPKQDSDSALNLSGISRARRGSATDPQSLYARKRREKINERLRVLQNLVPNGTKVDISTMLEEAVHYVKFLQLQIKLLSSDDMWMYAPICYNGMDLGLDLKLTPPNQS